MKDPNEDDCWKVRPAVAAILRQAAVRINAKDVYAIIQDSPEKAKKKRAVAKGLDAIRNQIPGGSSAHLIADFPSGTIICVDQQGTEHQVGAFRTNT